MKRLILDLRHVNKHVYKDKVKFDDWKVMEQYLQQGGYMFKFDIKQGYHHVDVDTTHQKILGFSWKVNGKIKYYLLFLPR